jgi:hypothetical protein
MKSNRNRGFKSDSDSEAYSFLDIPFILNLFAVLVLAGGYYYIIFNNLFPDYQTYIYWTVNVLISYNILVASTRSFIAPLLTIIAGAFGILAAGSPHAIEFLSIAECWQLAILGAIGLLITFVLRL